MKILLIGGSGNISWCCAKAAIEAGHEVWTLNRGATIKTRRPSPAEIKKITANIKDVASFQAAINGLEFDVVADFICYTPEQALMDVDLFQGRTGQFIFISSAGVYERPPRTYPITESNPLSNPRWEYAQNKINCEKLFLKCFREEGFPVTIVRPAHTYDTLIPDAVGNGDWTNAQRLLDGKPIILHGDGATLWTVTHSEDFAGAFIKLFNHPSAIGESFHITSDELLTWRQISESVATALGVNHPRFVFVPSETIARHNPAMGQGLLGHKTWCDIYDNAKIKSIAGGWRCRIPFEQGIRRTIDWLRADKARQRFNQGLNEFLDQLCRDYGGC